MPILARPLWLTQQNWLSSTKRNQAPYIATAKVPLPIEFQLCHGKAERVCKQISLDLEFNIGSCVSPTAKLLCKNICCSLFKYYNNVASQIEQQINDNPKLLTS
jgi:hypothetical protein